MSGEGHKPGRRAVVLATIAGGCAVAGGVAVPAIALVTAPLAENGVKGLWVRTVKVADLPQALPKRIAIVADRRDAWTVERNVELGSVWLVRRGEDVVAFSAVCPHLGCSVNAAPNGEFACPCHTSAFDPEGKKKSGPSPRDLDRLDTRIEEGFVAVDFKRFKIGVAEKVQS
jgi:menaquinol-cytochrome c reductase iron-sulfur subunit